MRRTSIALVLLLCFVVTSVMAAAPKDDPVKVYINGSVKQLKPGAFVRDGKVVYLPLLATAKVLKVTIAENKAKKTYTVSSCSQSTTIKASQGVRVKGDLMVPSDIASKALGFDVKWEKAAKAVRVTVKPAPKRPAGGST